mmetsp:Transcript_11067/g.20475  ORF Transcript_11067/g.20475 Transcript_11067/m.20475 type:complete len:223 (+) Transcript_11067:1928-2596(+)
MKIPVLLSAPTKLRAFSRMKPPVCTYRLEFRAKFKTICFNRSLSTETIRESGQHSTVTSKVSSRWNIMLATGSRMSRLMSVGREWIVISVLPRLRSNMLCKRSLAYLRLDSMMRTSSRTRSLASTSTRGSVSLTEADTKLHAERAAEMGFRTSCAMKSFNSLSFRAARFAASTMSCDFSAMASACRCFCMKIMNIMTEMKSDMKTEPAIAQGSHPTQRPEVQ